MAVALKLTTLHLYSQEKQAQHIGAAPTTFLARVVVNTGGKFVLTLFNGFNGQELAVIRNPATGDAFEYNAVVDRGLHYMLEEDPNDRKPYSVTVVYSDWPVPYL